MYFDCAVGAGPTPLMRDVVAGALRFDRADDHHAEAFAQRDQPRGLFVELRARLDRRGGAQRVAPRKRVDERRAFDAEAERLLDHAVEHRIAGLVLEVADQHRDRIVRGRHRADDAAAIEINQPAAPPSSDDQRAPPPAASFDRAGASCTMTSCTSERI